ncbi:dopamine receptor 1-like [Littorina saxatilis]|uniref:G-protein coupled receptors family 1 profile domain-containing protein n=1 Tax=Littorina saxatilis TaxID=31220 RepID=A0AAN9G647_9CAEN
MSSVSSTEKETNVSSSTPAEKDDGERENLHFVVWKPALIGTTLSVLVVAAVVGNLLICIAVCRDKRLWKKSYFFMVSLAVADLLIGLVVMPFAIYNDMHGHWIFGVSFCNMWIFSDIMCSTASILNLCVLAIDRYIHIRKPFQYDEWVTSARTAGVIATVWVVAILVASAHGAKLHSMKDNGLCLFIINPAFVVVASAISFYLPSIFMVTLYSKLFAHARYHANIIRGSITPDTTSVVRKSYIRQDLKAAFTLAVILGTFLGCWLPFFIAIIIVAYCPTCISPTTSKVVTWCGWLNSCLNPIIYSVFNTEFRAFFHRMLCSWKSVHPDVSDTTNAGPQTGFRPAENNVYPTFSRFTFSTILGSTVSYDRPARLA